MTQLNDNIHSGDTIPSGIEETSDSDRDDISTQPDIEQPPLGKIESSISAATQQYHTVISHVRSRRSGQTAPFTHPLTHIKTTSDVIVDFDGADDPYMPLNWPFRKKCITTFLYGLTTMGTYTPTLCAAFHPNMQ